MQAILLVLLAVFAVASAFKPSFLLRSSPKTAMKMVSVDAMETLKTSFNTAIDLTYNIDQPNAAITLAGGLFLATAIMGSLQAVLSQLADSDFYGKKAATAEPVKGNAKGKGRGKK